MSFIRLKNTVQDGDLVVLWGGRDFIQFCLIKAKSATHNNRGMFSHDNIIGVPYGSKVLSNTGQWLYALFPTPELWTRGLPHRTQILYHVDIGVILLHLDLKPGKVVIESGTGSGSLSTSIAKTISPNGKLFTFEFNEERAKAATEDFKKHELDKIIKVTFGDVCSNGFNLKDVADAVFLDLPAPWLAVKSANDALVENGRFCSFSPCIEQVQKTCEALRKLQFVDLITIECLGRNYDVRTTSIPVIPLEDLDSNSRASESSKMEEEPSRKRDRNEFESTNQSEKVSVESSKRKTNKKVEQIHQQQLLKPISDIRGHTGFLTFARKPVQIKD